MNELIIFKRKKKKMSGGPTLPGRSVCSQSRFFSFSLALSTRMGDTRPLTKYHLYVGGVNYTILEDNDMLESFFFFLQVSVRDLKTEDLHVSLR